MKDDTMVILGIGAICIVIVAMFAAFAGLLTAARNDLERKCRPRCAPYAVAGYVGDSDCLCDITRTVK